MNQGAKSEQHMLDKLGISELNAMQESARNAILAGKDTVLISPTGSGKTLAFLLPLLQMVDRSTTAVQVLIVVPSRELAIQIEQVMRDLGSGIKSNAVYGGQSFSKDLQNLAHPPAVLIGTPGRVADHLRRNTFSVEALKYLVLDEFDKSLEIGFAEEMSELVVRLPSVRQRILTSATEAVEVPAFVKLNAAIRINPSSDGETGLKIYAVQATGNNKLPTLIALLKHIGDGSGIIFCNFKDSIAQVSDHLEENGVEHGLFYGGLEQQDRERALIKFRNGTHRIIIATDLAARGLDIPELDFIIHYELPPREEEFIHRNGRTARMHSDGNAYVLTGPQNRKPEYMEGMPNLTLKKGNLPEPSLWSTLFISGGRKDKISKGDIAGLLMKQAKLSKDDVGMIELKQDCAFVAVRSSSIEQAIAKTNNSKIKKRKVRVYGV